MRRDYFEDTKTYKMEKNPRTIKQFCMVYFLIQELGLHKNPVTLLSKDYLKINIFT